MSHKSISWAYGVTTVPSRAGELFPMTLRSLARAGFDSPHLFVDGYQDVGVYERFGLDVTCRYPQIGAFGNWALGLWELWLRYPNTDYYAVFQDDFVAVRNLRRYIEQSHWEHKGYLNLYTTAQNEELARGNRGWCPSNQKGRGALALVFDTAAVANLLGSNQFVRKTLNAARRTCKIDGCVIESLKVLGYWEYIHYPSLVEHTGAKASAIGHDVGLNRTAPSFPGEDFDVMELLQ